MTSDIVLAAMLAELHRQVHQPADVAFVPFVGPSDIPSMVHIQGSIDVEALATAVMAAIASQAPLN